MAKKKTAKTKAPKTSQIKKDDLFYVGVRDPIELRNTLLESSKDLIQYLQRFEKLRITREEKKREMGNLKEALKEITKEAAKLKRLIPKAKIRAAIDIGAGREEPVIEQEIEEPVAKKKKAKKHSKAKKKVEKPQAHPIEKKEASELAKLEAELGAIEKRLTKLA